MRSLITGASGSVGSRLAKSLPRPVFSSDVSDYVSSLDVTVARDVRGWVRSIQPTHIFHLAGAKHAPEGELNPALVSRVNIDGTLNVLSAARREGAKVILASTCKACDPETAYGASKLIAERAVLNAGGVVVRFHNIPESCGNVFRLWEALPVTEPLPVTDCWRYFTPMDAAVELLAAAADFPSGRYAVDPGESRWMPAVARELYPDREQVLIPPRRGDRIREPLKASCERIRRFGPYLHILGAHDPRPVSEPVCVR